MSPSPSALCKKFLAVRCSLNLKLFEPNQDIVFSCQLSFTGRGLNLKQRRRRALMKDFEIGLDIRR